jgi:O-antigen/teichoic acid export membrane protein
MKMLIQNFLGRRYFSPIKHFNLREIKDHLVFGFYNMAENVVNYIISNVDNILIGGLLGVKELGFLYHSLANSSLPHQQALPGNYPDIVPYNGKN